MKSIIFLCAIFLTLVSVLSEVQTNYHDAIGIPTANRIKALEEAIQANRNITIENRIIGGELAPLNEYPFFAGLIISLVGTPDPGVCGASLLSPNRLVTAAHCNFDGIRLAHEFTVVLGSNMLFYGGERIVSRKVIMHPNYRHQFFINDIAMIYLPRNAKITNIVKPIRLPNYLESWKQFLGFQARSVGFGVTTDGHTLVNPDSLLKHITLQVVDNSQCQLKNDLNRPNYDILCTSGYGGVGLCHGDSGGPLYTIDETSTDKSIFLIGINSYKYGPTCTGGTGYTRVTSYMHFIALHLNN
ncbi:hypothetical protein HW555_001544 [Spodoptera exigua]|uniref:Peptidase S1 domain-containing protein n=1 Tax=Spodoptera exigua TaxID=7107 RepID=A0A835GS23_SPOEX|nr:hypothetical protein HW555_001544 [Spodoptera exigua]